MTEGTLKALADGNEDAYKKLFDTFYKPLAGFAYQYLKDPDMARDVAQNVFVKLFQRRGELPTVENIRGYLYRMVHNECLNEIRSHDARHRRHLSYAADAETLFENGVEQSEREYRMYQAIRALPPRCQQIFVMSRIEGKKNSDIASLLNLSVRTVETQISLALKTLRTSLVCLLPFLKFF